VPSNGILGEKIVSPIHSHEGSHHPGISDPHTWIYPENADGIGDAARAWGTEGNSTIIIHREKIDPSTVGKVGESGHGGMPFDMDDPYALNIQKGGVGISVAHIQNLNDIGASPLPVTLSREEEASQLHEKRDLQKMLTIDTERIPCPRLCGATFGKGSGSLSIFHNGEAKKMWNWFCQTDPSSRHSGTSNDPFFIAGRESSSRGKGSFLKETPRTLQDLLAMTSAAKEAQWGNRDQSDASSTSFRVSNGNFFEDDSEESSDSGEDEIEEVNAGNTLTGSAKGLYDSYFGNSKAVIKPPPPPIPSENEDEEDDDLEAAELPGPSSDLLSPFVRITYAYHKLALNNQSIALAQGWKLGEWPLRSKNDEPVEDPLESMEEKVRLDNRTSALHKRGK
jgi:hypothetical protein